MERLNKKEANYEEHWQLRGQLRSMPRTEEHWHLFQSKGRNQTQVQAEDIRWRGTAQLHTGQEDKPPFETRVGSIYTAQAAEITTDPKAASLVFHYAGLSDWRDVALRVLQIAGWHPSCVYEDTLYIGNEKENTPQWNKIERNTAEEDCHAEGEVAITDHLEIHIIDWTLEDIAAATMVIGYQGCLLTVEGNLTGKSQLERP